MICLIPYSCSSQFKQNEWIIKIKPSPLLRVNLLFVVSWLSTLFLMFPCFLWVLVICWSILTVLTSAHVTLALVNGMIKKKKRNLLVKNPNSCHFQLNQTAFNALWKPNFRVNMWKPLFTVFVVLHWSAVVNDNTPLGTNNICFSMVFFGILCHVVKICSREKSPLDAPGLCVSMSSNPHALRDILDTL